MKFVRTVVFIILIFLLIVAFQNLKEPVGIQVFFWRIHTTVLWTLVLSFLLGLVGGVSLYWGLSRSSSSEPQPSTQQETSTPSTSPQQENSN